MKTKEAIIKANLTTELKNDYMQYAVAVFSRALPCLYDGLKVSQRRVLQVMFEEGLFPDKRYVKSARITGLTMGFLHPHSDCYGTLVNMATEWNNNVPWIAGHGNFGSSVDNPASSRYTEAKLTRASMDILLQDSAVWETRPNYDGSRQEAVMFNTALPSVLLNGDSGIAVGFATRLAPHGLKSVVEAVKLICKEAKTEKVELENLRKSRQTLLPDFPTGCDIVQDEQLDAYTRTGSGNIRCLAKLEQGVQKRQRGKDLVSLTFTHLPPGTNPEKIGDQIKTELDKGRIIGITGVNDLSDLSGDRIEVVLKNGTNVDLVKKQLYRYTDLDLKYSAKTLVIDGANPVELSPVEIVKKWVDWRIGRLKAKFERELDLKSKRAHILVGLLKAINKLDLIIKKIRAAKDKAEAKAALMGGTLKFTSEQADAILEMRLRQLTNLDQSELADELATLEARIKELGILVKGTKEGTEARKKFLVAEVTEIGKKYGVDRKSAVIEASPELDEVKVEGTKKTVLTVSKPRFLKIDQNRGTVEQAKGPRGALVVDSKEKVVLMTEDGTLKKVSATYKGAISTGYSKLVLGKRETEVKERNYLIVFELGAEVRAMVIKGEDLCRSTSKGKKWLPDGGKLVYFGEGSVTIEWVSKRKKPTVLDLHVKPGKPGGRGTKIGATKDINL